MPQIVSQMPEAVDKSQTTLFFDSVSNGPTIAYCVASGLRGQLSLLGKSLVRESPSGMVFGSPCW